ncbi:cytidine deaminase [Sphaeroforma arctica JP610]|uniref:Cytidine deaminase n=1 Tax=Sphaeroforma arctica JP610 TaxID=667725 RepID=A0A0L0G741_9EUKA|nr:cytidine deaminase [Sphaeroforma arctica JP610]KNC84830.1 cytidine deaminase [Sphaeroforma arctica JP610]|eukprot:XP_014158732.1 cytidine deaminase [Sphaeroforma arctica JP610]
MSDKPSRETTLDAKVVKTLVERAQEARNVSYSPYSHFRVGACLLAKNGKYYSGANVENVSYGLTICAERTCLVKMVTDGCLKAKAIAVASDVEDFISPCGMCRQSLAEFCDPDVEVLMTRGDGSFVCITVSDLVPLLFTPSALEDGTRA